MSLRPETWKEAPDRAEYERREAIPANNRCEMCDGLGLSRGRYSHNGNDWNTCFACGGDGKDDPTR